LGKVTYEPGKAWERCILTSYYFTEYYLGAVVWKLRRPLFTKYAYLQVHVLRRFSSYKGSR
jgi:hypothetical protein